MKKILSVCFVLFVLTGSGKVASAQTEKGSFVLGASSNLEFSSLSVDVKREDTSLGDYKSSTFELTPGVGYFVANNLAIGVQLSVDRTAVKNGEKDTETNTMVLPFVIKYFGKGSLKPFVQAAYGFGWHNGSQIRETMKIRGYELGGGLAFFLNPNVSLDIGLGYSSATRTLNEISYQLSGGGNQPESKIYAKGIGGNVGFSIYL